jgi:hypothetical protein
MYCKMTTSEQDSSRAESVCSDCACFKLSDRVDWQSRRIRMFMWRQRWIRLWACETVGAQCLIELKPYIASISSMMTRLDTAALHRKGNEGKNVECLPLSLVKPWFCLYRSQCELDRICGPVVRVPGYQRRCIVFPVRYELNLYMLCRRK